MSECCYIYWDDDDILERQIHVQCQECFKKNHLGRIWPADFGYGVTKIKCCHCGHIIHEGADEEDQASI